MADAPEVSAAPSNAMPTWLGAVAAPSASVSLITQVAPTGRPVTVREAPSASVKAASAAASGIRVPRALVQTSVIPNGPNDPADAAVSTCFVTVSCVTA